MNTKKTLCTAAFAALLAMGASMNASAQAFVESFDNISNLPSSGWATQNNSSPVGSTSWFQGNTTVFNAYAGATDAYIGANFNSTGSTGTISNWLITPNRTFRNGDVVTFYTRKPNGQDFPDRLEVRLSTNGASTNVGTGAAAFGDFSTLLLSVNPSLVTGVYPQTWTQYTITISGLPAPTSGRAAFRYFVTGAGSLGTNSDYIGIDEFTYTPYVCPTLSMSPASGALPGGSVGQAYSMTFSQTGALGTPNFAITAGALPPGLTQSVSGVISGTPTATGSYSFTSTISDASGCSGSAAYTINVVKGSQSISFPTQTPANQSFVAGGTFSINPAATTSSGLPISYTSNTASVCSVNGSSITMGAAGICTVVASQTGDANYNPATPVSQDITIDKAPQSIAFTSTAPANAKVGDVYNVTATGGLSGNSITFSIDPSTSANCSISGSSVTLTGAGNCIINANQTGNANYLNAPQAQQSVGVGKAAQAITFTSTVPVNAKINGTYPVTATGGLSGNAVTFAIDSSSASICSIAGSVVAFNAAGTCTINANQLGNANYNDAAQAQQTVTVGQGGSNITMTSSANPSQPGQSVTFTISVAFNANQSALLRTKAAPVPTGTIELKDGNTSLGTASLVNGSATITTTQMTSVGTHSLTATYSGDLNYPAEVSEAFSQSVVSGVLTPVPTLNELGLIVLSLLLAMFGLARSRCRQG